MRVKNLECCVLPAAIEPITFLIDDAFLLIASSSLI